MWPAWSGCMMTCFCCITGTTIILFTNMSLNHLGFAMLSVGTDNIVHWLYFDYICSL